ncbi:MAG: carbohydrate kinase [Sphingomonadales bacterium]|nr:carbohydrate kinase [Sphingomonadales bacterium]
MEPAFAIVVDIGKTLSKVSWWSRTGALLARETRANARVEEDGIARLDARGIGDWLLAVLAARPAPAAEFLIPVAHGAGVAALREGALVLTPLDYEAAPPASLLARYRAGRDAFAETGSPALPQGLNLGAQLAWMEALDPAGLAGATLLPWAQYWAWFLSGAAVSEVTSLGCHSDCWAPFAGDFSAMAIRRGWARRFARRARADAVVGTLRPDIARRTGLSPAVKVLAGLHDTNAALLAARGALGPGEASVLSTGTWFIALRLGEAATAPLPEARDCLVNVDIAARPVPSARFMGGREIAALIGEGVGEGVGEGGLAVDAPADQPRLLAAAEAVLAAGALPLPTLAPGCGPFPQGVPRWLAEPVDRDSRRAAACLYAALVADVSLGCIDARARLLIEGRFARAEVFTRALAALRPDLAVDAAARDNDVSFGALRLVLPALAPPGGLRRIAPLAPDLAAHRARWQAAIASQRSAA